VIWGERRRAWISRRDDLKEVTVLTVDLLPSHFWISLEAQFAGIEE